MWSIAELINTVEISDKCAEELFKNQSYEGERWYYLDEVTYEGKLSFDSDSMEHMDYLFNSDVNKILKKYKVQGDICFGSVEGDNKGSFWGYRFDGKGNMKNLEGKIDWYEKKE